MFAETDDRYEDEVNFSKNCAATKSQSSVIALPNSTIILLYSKWRFHIILLLKQGDIWSTYHRTVIWSPGPGTRSQPALAEIGIVCDILACAGFSRLQYCVSSKQSNLSASSNYCLDILFLHNPRRSQFAGFVLISPLKYRRQASKSWPVWDTERNKLFLASSLNIGKVSASAELVSTPINPHRNNIVS